MGYKLHIVSHLLPYRFRAVLSRYFVSSSTYCNIVTYRFFISLTMSFYVVISCCCLCRLPRFFPQLTGWGLFSVPWSMFFYYGQNAFVQRSFYYLDILWTFLTNRLISWWYTVLMILSTWTLGHWTFGHVRIYIRVLFVQVFVNRANLLLSIVLPSSKYLLRSS